MRSPVLALAVLSALALIGCQQTLPFGGKPRTKEETKFAVVSLSPSTTELAYAATYSVPLKGRTDACDFPVTAAKIPIVVHNTKIDYEMLNGIKPDLVIYDPALYSDAEVEKIKQTGAEMMPFTAKNLEEYEAYIRKLCVLVGGETNASEYIDKVYGAREIALSGVKGRDVKAMVLMGGKGGDHMAVGTESMLGDLVKESGGHLIGPKGDKFVPINIEEVINGDPDIIFCPDDSYDAISKDPRLANLRVVKEKRVLPVKADVLLRVGSRVDTLIAAFGAELRRAADDHDVAKSSKPAAVGQ
ncbi:MAG: ABC transporter substrate-binding protein [Armatimonadetes bacterium]|nr:ABC transporter substrate-binding protein [Armatimonadota bacterium]